MWFIIIYYLIIGLVVLLGIHFFIRRYSINFNNKDSGPDKKREAKPTEKPESKKPAVPKKPWPTKVKVGLAIAALVLGAVSVFWAFDVKLPSFQLPSFRISNGAFITFLIPLLWGVIAVIVTRKWKHTILPLVVSLAALLVFWQFNVPILLMADQDGEEFGYNPMDFEPAGGPLDTLMIGERIIQFDVSDPLWSSTGLYIPSNSIVTITAEGRFMWDPGVCPSLTGPEGAWPVSEVRRSDQFLLPNEPIVCLMGKIGNKIFFIGKATGFRVRKEGVLQLAINERWERHCWNDNSGTLIIRIKVS